MSKLRILPTLCNIYIFIIAFSVAPLLLFTSPYLKGGIILELLFWVALEVIADFKPIIRLKSGEINEVTLSFSVHLSVIILLGTAKAIWIVVVGTLIVEILSKKPFHKVLFNAGEYGLSILISGSLFYLFKLSPDNVVLDILKDAPAALIAVISYFLVNTFFVTTVISLSSGSRFTSVFLNDFKLLSSHFFTLTPISIAIALLYDPKSPYVIFLMIPPILMADQALRRYYGLQQETQETLKLLADIINERDEYTFTHTIRVSEYSKKIAQHLCLSISDIEQIEMAGRIHDLGKVVVNDKLLRKPGRLTDEEYDIIKKHPEIAYRLLKNLKPYKKGAEYVLYHHERMDGTGYPNKISGNAIPLGARILTVADSYDAMVSDRPYRKAMPQSIAVNELLKYSGTQFDSNVVQAFIQILKEQYGYKGEN